MEGQAVGQGSAQQRDEGEEDAEVGRSEICRPRGMCLWPGSWESMTTLRSHSSMAQVISPRPQPDASGSLEIPAWTSKLCSEGISSLDTLCF